MKKYLTIITIAMFVVSCSSKVQKDEKAKDEKTQKHPSISKSSNRETLSNPNAISVKWKIKPNETIGYKTALDQVENSGVKIDFGDNMTNEAFKELFEDSEKEFKKTSLITTLQWNKRGNIEAKMFTENFNDETTKSFDLKDLKNIKAQSMMKGIVLRGEINEKGQIESFYLKSAQKNLIALYFQLPDKPIKLGDSWSLDINFLQFDQSFVCKSADRKNKVELIEVLKENNDTIVVFKYNISESASGLMKNPINNQNIETSLAMKYNGIAEFSVSKGRWIKYNGVLETTQKGFASGKIKQILSLIPFDHLTKEMINIK